MMATVLEEVGMLKKSRNETEKNYKSWKYEDETPCLENKTELILLYHDLTHSGSHFLSRTPHSLYVQE